MDKLSDLLNITVTGMVEAAPEPQEDVDPEIDEVVGELTDDMKQLLGVAAYFNEKAMSVTKTLPPKATADDETRALAKINLLTDKEDLVMSIFWNSVREAFDLWNVKAMAIRKGWRVVKTKQKADAMDEINILRIVIGK